jgi:SNF2 family DNA or RNA helicase
VVKPIKQGQRREGMASEVVTSIVSISSYAELLLNQQLRLGVMHKEILPHFVIRRTKKLIADEVSYTQSKQYSSSRGQLPTKRDMVVFCPLANRQIAAYQAFVASEDVHFVVQRNDPCSCGSANM